MGTDATGLVEVKRGSEWLPELRPIWPQAEATRIGEAFDISPGLPRDYALFSILADVRNRTGRGFKTMQTVTHPEYGSVEFEYDTDDGGHDPLTPIAMPRGIPIDASIPWREFVETMQGAGVLHDPTFLTLAEIEAGDWEQIVYYQAVVPEKTYLHWLETGHPPKGHPRGMGGDGVLVVNEVEYAAGQRGENATAVDFRWTGKTAAEEMHKSWGATLDIMRLIAPDHDPEKVRLMVAFDS